MTEKTLNEIEHLESKYAMDEYFKEKTLSKEQPESCLTHYKKEKTLCKKCGHVGSMHCDGENICAGECNMEIGFDDKGPVFCDCKEFKK